MTLRILPWLVLATWACKPKDDDVSTESEDTAPYTYRDTEVVVDTDDSAHDDTVTDDTGHTGDDTEDTSEPPDAVLTSLELYPKALVVHPGATFPTRVVATWDDGSVADVGPTVEFDLPDIASVAGDGAITALAAGTVTLSVTYGELETSTYLEVRDDSTLRLTVIDSTTGLPVTGASVAVNDGSPGTVDKAGQLSLLLAPPKAPPTDTGDTAPPDTSDSGDTGAPVEHTGGPIVIDVVATDYVPLTIWGTVNRDFTVELQPRSGFFPPEATVEGTVNFGSVPEPAFDEMVVGMAGASLQRGILAVRPDDLFAPDRELTVFGLDVDMPANLYLQGHAETYAANAEAGHPAVWSICGALPTADVTSVSGGDEALDVVMDNIGGMVWTWDPGVDVEPESVATVNIEPNIGLARVVNVEVGELSLGFGGDEQPLVFVGEMLPTQGFVVTGLGVGAGTVEAHAALITLPDSTGEWAWMIAQVGGIGSGGGYIVSTAPVIGFVAATLPPMPRVPWNSFSTTERTFEIGSDTSAEWMHAVLRDRNGMVREFVFAGGAHSGAITTPGLEFYYPGAEWDVLALETTRNTFEGFVGGASLAEDDVMPYATVAARVRQKF